MMRRQCLFLAIVKMARIVVLPLLEPLVHSDAVSVSRLAKLLKNQKFAKRSAASRGCRHKNIDTACPKVCGIHT